VRKRLSLLVVAAVLLVGGAGAAAWHDARPEGPGTTSRGSQSTNTDQLPAPPRPPRDRPLERVVTAPPN